MKDVELISVTPDAEKTMAYCARVSSNDQDNPNIHGLLRYCIQHGHWSVFELAHMTLEIDTSRAISAQILRHRSFCFQEFSQRYQSLDESGVKIYAARRQDNKNRQNSIDDLSDEVKEEWEQRQMDNWKTSFEHYTWALDNEIAKECARTVLPLGTSTKMYMSGTVRSWIHYINLRTANGTQAEHMHLANEAKEIFCEQFPTVSKALGWITN
jgi:thymidylate synthase (FAD)